MPLSRALKELRDRPHRNGLALLFCRPNCRFVVATYVVVVRGPHRTTKSVDGRAP